MVLSARTNCLAFDKCKYNQSPQFKNSAEPYSLMSWFQWLKKTKSLNSNRAMLLFSTHTTYTRTQIDFWLNSLKCWLSAAHKTWRDSASLVFTYNFGNVQSLTTICIFTVTWCEAELFWVKINSKVKKGWYHLFQTWSDIWDVTATLICHYLGES